MSDDSSSLIAAGEQIIATASAAEAQLGWLAAEMLTPSAVFRTWKAAAVDARRLRGGDRVSSVTLPPARPRPAYVAPMSPPAPARPAPPAVVPLTSPAAIEPRSLEDDTEELISAAIRTPEAVTSPAAESPWDDGAEGSADTSVPIDTDEHAAPAAPPAAKTDWDSLVSFSEPEKPEPTEPDEEIEVEVEVEPIDEAPAKPANDWDSLISFDDDKKALPDDEEPTPAPQPAPDWSSLVSFAESSAESEAATDQVSTDPASSGTDELPVATADDEGDHSDNTDIGLSPARTMPIKRTRTEPPRGRPATDTVESFDLMGDSDLGGNESLSALQAELGIRGPRDADVPEDEDHQPARPGMRPGSLDSASEVIIGKAAEEARINAAAADAPAATGRGALGAPKAVIAPPKAVPAAAVKPTAAVGVAAGGKAAAAAAGAAKRHPGAASGPVIRGDKSDARPKAAAIQLGPKGQTKVMGFEEEEEPLEMEEAEGTGDSPSGEMTLNVEEYEYEEAELEEDEEESTPTPAPPPARTAAPPRGPDINLVKSLMGQAEDAVRDSKMDLGVQFYSDVLDADPDYIDALLGRGRLYLDLGDYGRAMSDFTRAEDLDGESPEWRVAVGELYFTRKDYAKAITYFDDALKRKSDHAMALCRRGISHYYRKEYHDAVTDLTKAQSLDPEIPNIQTFLSMAKKKAPGKAR